MQSSALPLGYVAGSYDSGWRESNPRVDLGKVTGYHYITPAHGRATDPFGTLAGPSYACQRVTSASGDAAAGESI